MSGTRFGGTSSLESAPLSDGSRVPQPPSKLSCGRSCCNELVNAKQRRAETKREDVNGLMISGSGKITVVGGRDSVGGGGVYSTDDLLLKWE